MCEQVWSFVYWHLNVCILSKLLCICSIASTVLLITTTPQQPGYVLGPKMTMYIYCMLVTCHASLHCLPLKKIAQSAFWVNVTVLLGQPLVCVIMDATYMDLRMQCIFLLKEASCLLVCCHTRQ